MKLSRPYYPAIWFLLGALATSEPWSWFLTAPAGLSARQLQLIGPIWRAAFAFTCFAGFLGYALGIALFRSHPRRRLSMALGAVFGLAVVAGSRLPPSTSLNFAPLALGGAAVGLAAGFVVGFRGRRIHHSLQPDTAVSIAQTPSIQAATEPPSASVPIAASLLSMALMLGASMGCLFAGHATGARSYVLAGIGFLVLAPLWYRSPISIRAMLSPIGSRLTPCRQFSWIDTLLALVGYLLVLAAIPLWLTATV
jgi:hypothetical protein